MTWYASRGPASGELLSYRGRLLIHDSPDELEWLIPGFRAVPLRGDEPEEIASRLGQPVMRWAEHPDMAAVRWPLNRKDFL